MKLSSVWDIELRSGQKKTVATVNKEHPYLPSLICLSPVHDCPVRDHMSFQVHPTDTACQAQPILE